MKIEKIPEGYLLARKGGNGCELWRKFNGAESLACDAIDELIAERDALRAAVRHEANCVDAAKAEIEALRAKIEQMEQQEPIGEIVAFGEFLHEPSWKRGKLPHLGTKLYALPGAQPAPSVPDDVMRDAERYRYLRGRDDSTAGVGCWLEAGGKACARGWLNGDQLDRAIDCAIEALAAAPEAKP